MRAALRMSLRVAFGATILSGCATGASARVASPARAAVPPAAPETSALAQAVEHGILPAVLVAGAERSTLADRMAALKVPALSIAVFDHYEVIWAHAYGTADVDAHTKVTTETLFQAGSISKSVNALGVLLAASQGKFSLDAPVSSLLRSWSLPENELTAKAQVTLRLLLSHRAGTTVHGFPGYPTGTPLPTLIDVLDGKPPANTPPVRVSLPPGSVMRYSGGGITITQQVLVDAFNEPYPSILDRLVLTPFGMRQSTYEQPLPPGRLASAAAGHDELGAVVPSKRHVYPEMAAAGLWTTPSDLATFFCEIARARAGKSARLSTAVAREMTTELDARSHVALGVFLSTRNGAPLFGHDGVDQGFQASALASLDQGFGLVLMANSLNGMALFPEIERTVFSTMHWPGADTEPRVVALSDAERGAWVGEYQMNSGVPIAITAKGGELFMARPLFEPAPLLPLSATRLAQRYTGFQFVLRGADGFAVENTRGPSGEGRRLADGEKLPLFELAAGRDAEAVEVWRRRIEKQPGLAGPSLGFHMEYGGELLASGNPRAAARTFRTIIAVFPDASYARAQLGSSLEKSGERLAALAAYRGALDGLDADPRLSAEERTSLREQLKVDLARVEAPPGR